MVECNFKSADPGKIIPTPEQCQTSNHGCLINAASSYCSAVSSAAPSLADTRFSGADTALGTASVARTAGEPCLPGMGPCE